MIFLIVGGVIAGFAGFFAFLGIHVPWQVYVGLGIILLLVLSPFALLYDGTVGRISREMDDNTGRVEERLRRIERKKRSVSIDKRSVNIDNRHITIAGDKPQEANHGKNRIETERN